ncbi:MAG: endonuclease/exonuclease/phosphatase family protein [Candidatus Acidiferrales bacterium]
MVGLTENSINTGSTPPEDAEYVRVATYNVHKCRGMDGRVRADRIAEVLNEIDADIVALQEVVCVEGRGREHHQAQYIAESLGYHAELGENRRHKGGAYGNVLLSRFPIHQARNYDISVSGRERRGCLRADVRLESGDWLHVFNLHLGTSFFERRKQARGLFEQQILNGKELSGHKIILGDFNEWTHGLASRMFRSHFKSADPRAHRGRTRTFPGFLPVLPLDHVYFDHGLRLRSFAVHRTRTALVASDHLPLVAEFHIPVSANRPNMRELLKSLAAIPDFDSVSHPGH